jgi:PAS domain S-box-containing protein
MQNNMAGNLTKKKPKQSVTTVSTPNQLHELAFENSSLPQIISSGKEGTILFANKSACKLLGYDKNQLCSKSRADIVEVANIAFKDMLVNLHREGHASGFVMMKCKKGKNIPCEMTTALFLDNTGIKKEIITIADRRTHLLKQKNIDLDNKKIVNNNIALAISRQKLLDIKKAKRVAANITLARSKQRTIDARNARVVTANIFIAISRQLKIDIKKEKIVADNIAKAILKQKHIDAKNARAVADDILLAISKQLEIDIIREKIVADNIVKAITRQLKTDALNGRIVSANIALARSEQIKIDARKNQEVAQDIIAAQAKANLEKLEYETRTRGKLLAEFKKKFRLIFHASKDVMYDTDLVSGEVIISKAFEKDYGYPITSHMTPGRDWFPHIHPEDRIKVEKDFNLFLASADTEWKQHYRFIKSNGDIANVSSSCLAMRDTNGKAYRVIGAMQDLSKEKKLEDRLQHEIAVKERQIVEAMIDAKETERADIGKELHDNINQLLGASRLYLELAKTGHPDSEMLLKKSSEYSFEAIEEIRKLTKGLTTDVIKNLGLQEAIENLVHDTMQVNPLRIRTDLESFNDFKLGEKFRLGLFRIVQEQMNNILKHAQASNVYIGLLQNKKTIRLIIKDDGVGFNTGQERKGIGLSNINSRIASFHGISQLVSASNKGCVLSAIFPANDALLYA